MTAPRNDSWTQRLGRALLAALVVASATAGCAEQQPRNLDQNESVNQTPTAGGDASTSGPLDDDGVVMGKMRQHTRFWNSTMSPLVADYLDPNVSAEQFVKSTSGLVRKLEPRIRKMAELAATLKTPELRRIVTATAFTYRDKLAAFMALVNAVSAGDADGQRAGQEKLQDATTEANELAAELQDFLDAAAAGSP